MLRRLFGAAAIVAATAFVVPTPAFAAQGSLCLPTTGIVSGLQVVTSVNAALEALVTSNAGGTAPGNDCSAAPVAGQVWLDTSTDPDTWKLYEGTQWLAVGRADATNHVWVPPVGGGIGSLASATTTDLGSVPQAYVAVTGTATVISLGASAADGVVKFVRFAGALTLTHNGTSLILPTAANIATAAGDVALFAHLGSGNWAALAYTRADGTSLSSGSAFSSQIALTGEIRPAALSADTHNWNPSGLPDAAVVAASSSTAVSLTGIAAQPAGTLLFLHNVGTATITLANGSASSSAANRFTLGADVVLAAKEAILLRYDGTLANWTAAASFRQTATQSQAETGTNNSAVMTPLRVAEAIAALGGSGLKGLQVFTSSGPYTRTAGATKAIVIATGGGAGGQGKANNSTGVSEGGGGGETRIALVTPGSSETVTIGAGGVGQLGTTGTNGGTTSFGSHVTANGGVGTGAGGTGGTGGTFLGSQSGGPGIGDPGQGGVGGGGGGSFWGPGAPPGSSLAAEHFGGGGRGSANNGGSAKTGGGGKSGVVVVLEF